MVCLQLFFQLKNIQELLIRLDSMRLNLVLDVRMRCMHASHEY